MGGSSVDSETIASWGLSWCQSAVEFPCLRRWLMSLWCRRRASPPHDVRHRFASKPSHAIAWSAVWVSAPSMPQEYCDEDWMQFLWKHRHTHIHVHTNTHFVSRLFGITFAIYTDTDKHTDIHPESHTWQKCASESPPLNHQQPVMQCNRIQ